MPIPIQITLLPAGVAPLGGDERVPVTQGGVTVSVAAADIAAAAPSSVIVQVYVSVATGDDADDGLTPATAVATAQAFIDRHTTGAADGYDFHFDTGTHAQFKFPAGWGQKASVWLFGDGAGQVGDDGMIEVVAASAAQAATTTEVVEAAIAFTSASNQATIEVLDGVAAGARRDIVRTDGVLAYFNRAIAGFAAGDSFRIVRPGAVHSITVDSVIASGIGSNLVGNGLIPIPDFQRVLGIVNMEWAISGTGNGAVVSGCTVLAFGLRLTGTGNRMFAPSALYAGPTMQPGVLNEPWQDALPYISAANPANPITEAEMDLRWEGWGITIPTDGNIWGFTNFLGYLSQANVTSQIRGGVQRIQGGSGGLYVGDGAFCDLRPPTDSYWYTNIPGGTAAILVEGARLVAQPSGRCFLEATASVALLAIRNAQVYLGNFGTFEIRSSATFGSRVTSASTIVLGTGAVVTIEGSTPGVNDLSVDGTTPLAASVIANANDFVQFGPNYFMRD